MQKFPALWIAAIMCDLLMGVGGKGWGQGNSRVRRRERMWPGRNMGIPPLCRKKSEEITRVFNWRRENMVVYFVYILKRQPGRSARHERLTQRQSAGPCGWQQICKMIFYMAELEWTRSRISSNGMFWGGGETNKGEKGSIIYKARKLLKEFTAAKKDMRWGYTGEKTGGTRGML